jgi:hypothetical protein
MITARLVNVPGKITVTAQIDETDKVDPENDPGRMDSITVVIADEVTATFTLTTSGGARTVTATGPLNQTFTVRGTARQRRTGWSWSLTLAGP